MNKLHHDINNRFLIFLNNFQPLDFLKKVWKLKFANYVISISHWTWSNKFHNDDYDFYNSLLTVVAFWCSRLCSDVWCYRHLQETHVYMLINIYVKYYIETKKKLDWSGILSNKIEEYLKFFGQLYGRMPRIFYP